MKASTLDVIMFVIQLLSLIALVIYVVKTAEMAEGTRQSARAMDRSVAEMVEDRDHQIAPYVVVYFDHQTDSPIFDLVIKNTGRTAARDVEIVFDPPLQSSLKNYDINNLAFLHRVIPTLPPDYEIRASVDVIENALEFENLPKQYRVSVSYTGGIKATRREAGYLLDLNIFQGILETHTRSLTDLSHAVEKISDKLDELSKTIRENTKPF
ncbi:MAG: hypothetical protein KBA05_00980 [Anaerolineaceae bacterium]|jgi:uncharacterized protein YoxC|nr:hypothetical protein [Anaerolineaceae bacterium]MDI9530459.1 hypothetical protein [Chloroflexota bacterium]